MNSEALGTDALRDMRRERRRHRVADMEWFEALYRVYLAALLGGGAILYLSDLVTDEPLTGTQITDVIAHTPHAVGLVTALVVFLGLRSGLNGGPIAVEEPEVRHVLMAPVPHQHVLLRPAIQRLRTFVFFGAITGGVANQLLGRRMPSVDAGLLEFAFWGAVAGSLIGALFIVTALIVHGLSAPRWMITPLAAGLVAWQAVVTFSSVDATGPFDFVGNVAQWWHSFSVLDVVGVVAICALGAVGLAVTGRLSLEALSRRSSLVSQLKFAVTLQDIRTVILLRRQLSQEFMRVKPWWKLPRALRRDVVIARGLRSLMHFPARRLLRMCFLAGAAGAALVVVWRGTTPVLVVAGLLLFVLGLDAVEPLSQEVDQPDRTDALPIERGLLMTRHLLVPACAVVPFVVLGVVVAYILEPRNSTIAYGFIVGLPAAWGGVAGAVINAVKGAPDPVGGAMQSLAMPPEVSGMTSVVRAIWPPVISIVCSAPVFVLREAVERNNDIAGNTVRSSAAILVVLGLVAGWVRQRDHILAWFRTAQQQAAASSTSSSPTTEGS